MIIWRRNLYVLFGLQMLSMVGFSMVFPFLPLYINEIGVKTWGSVEFWSGMVFSAQAITPYAMIAIHLPSTLMPQVRQQVPPQVPQTSN